MTFTPHTLHIAIVLFVLGTLICYRGVYTSPKRIIWPLLGLLCGIGCVAASSFLFFYVLETP